MKTVKEVRIAFWESFPGFKSEFRTRKSHNDYNATIRTTFNDWVDGLQKDGEITESLARRIIL